MKNIKSNHNNSFLSKDRNIAILSFAIAIFLWIVTSISIKDTFVKTIVDIPISINTSVSTENTTNLSYSITNSSEKATVDISGRKELISTISKDDIMILADISNIKSEGTYEVKLFAVDLKGVDYIISNVKPNTVFITAKEK